MFSDVLVGINLLREGLDIPEITLVAILDADKEGFLALGDIADPDYRPRGREMRRDMLSCTRIRSQRSMQMAIDETKRRREIQMKYKKSMGSLHRRSKNLSAT